MALEQSLLQRAQRAGLTTWLLAAACAWALLLWLGAALGMGGRLAAPAALPPGPLPPPAAPAPDRIGPLSQYAEAAARPLFTEDRRPRAFIANAADPDAGGSGNAFDYVLTGVLISPQARLAILQPGNGGQALRVREGAAPEGAPGWRLVELQPRQALFEGPGGQVALDLRVFGAPAPPPGMDKPEPPAAPAASDVDAASGQQQRLDDLRRRIEARRAQLQQQQPSAPAAASAGPARPLSGPGK